MRRSRQVVGAGVVLALLATGCGDQTESAPSGVLAGPSLVLAPADALDFHHDHGGSGARYFVETMGSGAALFDADADGDLDALLLDGAPLPGCVRRGLGTALYLGDGSGRFVRADFPSDLGYAMGVAIGDVDDDGDEDVFLACFGPDRLLLAEDGAFHPAGAEHGLGDPGWSTSATFFDADRDGSLDLYVARYVEYVADAAHTCRAPDGSSEYCEPDVFPALPDRFHRNLGSGRFEECAAGHGLAVERPGRGLGVVATDVDLDGSPDLFVANDRSPNFLFVGDGAGRFSEEGLFAGAAFAGDGVARAGMGVDAGDVDGDGDFDLLVVNFGNESATLLENDGHGAFRDVSASSGVQAITAKPLGFGTGFFDVDLDGDLDLFVANGHVLDTIERYGQGSTHAQRNQLLLGDGEGRFEEAPCSSNPALDVARVSRGAAFGDVDGDGDVDVLVSNCADRADLCLVQGSPTNHWIGLDVRFRGRAALGARVEIATPRGTCVREVRAGGSYLSSRDPRVVVGLGAMQPPATLEVRVFLPGAPEPRVIALAPDRFHRVDLGPR